jgi:hypothetical protein
LGSGADLSSHRRPVRYVVTAVLITVIITILIVHYGTLLIASPGRTNSEHFIQTGTYAETASYIVWKEGNTYYSKNGATGKIDYFGTSFSSILQNILNALPASGGLVLIKEGNYTLDSTVTIPIKRNIAIVGTSFLGKSYYTGGTHIEARASPAIQTAYNNDLRSVTGLSFQYLKLIDKTGSGNSIGLHLSNVDGLSIDHSFFSGFGTAVNCDYKGVSLPKPEQPGSYWITNNLFTEGKGTYFKCFGATQVFVVNNVFEAWGPITFDCEFNNTDKVRILGNEFNMNTTFRAAIRIHFDNNTYPHLEAARYIITSNWFNKNSATDNFFIEVSGPVSSILSEANMIQYDFKLLNNPTEYRTPINWISSWDYIGGFSDPEKRIKDVTSVYPAGQTHVNRYAPAFMYANVRMSPTLEADATALLRMGNSPGTLTEIATARILAGQAQQDIIIPFFIPTGVYFRLDLTNAKLLRLMAVYT